MAQTTRRQLGLSYKAKNGDDETFYTGAKVAPEEGQTKEFSGEYIHKMSDIGIRSFDIELDWNYDELKPQPGGLAREYSSMDYMNPDFQPYYRKTFYDLIATFYSIPVGAYYKP